MKRIDLTGIRFNQLVAIKFTGETKINGNAIWLFICDCGNQLITEGYSVKTGKIKSCKECGKKRAAQASIKHGLSNTPEFRTWAEIKIRCYNIKSTSYERYGARGITMCDRWINSFENFLCDMGRKPSRYHSIDRINNNGDYSPQNCRWASPIEQANNKSNNVVIEHNGIKDTIPGWCRRTGLTYASLRHRILIAKWDIEKALTTKMKK